MEEIVTFEELSQELRKARLAKKWRPRDIARRTRIQYEYIKSIESGDFTFMPEPIIRGYIKSYSRDVGLDQNEMIDKYEQAKTQAQKAKLKKTKTEELKDSDKEEKKKHEENEKSKDVKRPEKTATTKSKKVEETKEKTEEKTADIKEAKKESTVPAQTTPESTKEEKQSIIKDQSPKSAPEKFESEVITKEEKPNDKKTKSAKLSKVVQRKPEKFFQKYRSELILAGILLVVVIAITFTYLIYGTDYFAKEAEPVEKISVFEAHEQNLEDESAKKAAVGSISKEKPVTETNAAPILDEETVKLRILAAERTWVRMVTDSTDTTEYMFTAGTTRFFEAKQQLELKIGRADGLMIWVNEDSIGKLGTAAEIVGKLVITPEGISTKQIRKPQPSQPSKKDTTVILFP